MAAEDGLDSQEAFAFGHLAGEVFSSVVSWSTTRRLLLCRAFRVRVAHQCILALD